MEVLMVVVVVLWLVGWLVKFSMNTVVAAQCVKYVEPAAPDSAEVDALLDLQQLYFCPMCVRSRRPPLELLSTLTCSLQSLMVALPEVTAAEALHRRAMCWQDNVQKLLQSDEVRDVRNELAEIRLMGRIAMSRTAYIFQRGITLHYVVDQPGNLIVKCCKEVQCSTELELI